MSGLLEQNELSAQDAVWSLVSRALLAAVSKAEVLLSVVSAVGQVVEIVEPVLFAEKDIVFGYCHARA